MTCGTPTWAVLFLRLQLTDVEVLATYEHLQSLDVSCNNLTSLSSLEHLPYLTRLNASGNKLSDFDVEVPRNAPGDQAWTLGAKHAGSNLIEVDLSDNAIEVLGAQETHRRLEKLIWMGIACTRSLDSTTYQG